MTTVPTPSDSQDGARRRDDADTFGPHRMERDKKGPFCFHCQVNWPCMPVEAYRTGRADVARLEAERDEWQAIAEDWRAATKRYDRAWIKLKAEQDAMRPVVEAAKAYRVNAASELSWPYRAERASELREALYAAVDQTTPSSPPETPHTADGGEAGVVEGAVGSEAAEGEHLAEWEAKAIEAEWARREGVLDRDYFTEAELTALTCRKCGAWLAGWTAEPCDFMNRDGAKYVIAAIRTNQPCGCSWRESVNA